MEALHPRSFFSGAIALWKVFEEQGGSEYQTQPAPARQEPLVLLDLHDVLLHLPEIHLQPSVISQLKLRQTRTGKLDDGLYLEARWSASAVLVFLDKKGYHIEVRMSGSTSKHHKKRVRMDESKLLLLYLQAPPLPLANIHARRPWRQQQQRTMKQTSSPRQQQLMLCVRKMKCYYGMFVALRTCLSCCEKPPSFNAENER